MSSKESHVAAAKRNQRTVDFLLSGADEHLPWVAAVAFYKALHVVEAVFAGDSQSPVKHTDEHKTRNAVLKTTNRYRQLCLMYRPLFEASLVARYLREDQDAPTHDVFAQYMPRQVVEAKLLGHYLPQLEKTAGRLLGDPSFLDDNPSL